MTLHRETVEQIVDGFAAGYTVGRIAEDLGLTEELVRSTLEDPETSKLALNRKLGQLGIVTYGRLLDKLVEIAQDGSSAQSLKAIQILMEQLEERKDSGDEGPGSLESRL